MADYVYTDHAQYTIKTYAKMALFRLVLLGCYIITLLLTLVGIPRIVTHSPLVLTGPLSLCCHVEFLSCGIPSTGMAQVTFVSNT